MRNFLKDMKDHEEGQKYNVYVGSMEGDIWEYFIYRNVSKKDLYNMIEIQEEDFERIWGIQGIEYVGLNEFIKSDGFYIGNYEGVEIREFNNRK